MVRERLSALRALARAKHRNAGKKVSRIQNSDDGILIRGSKHDPRRDAKAISRYTEKQLNAYISKLDKFLSRKTQFVADAYSKPIPKQTWKRWLAAEDARNRRKADLFNKVKDIELPNGQGTIGDYEARTRPKRPEMTRSATANPYAQTQRGSRDFTSVKSVEKLIRKAQRDWLDSDIKKRVKMARKVMDDMLEHVGDGVTLRNRIKGLNDWQINILWNYSGRMPQLASMAYVHRKNQLTWRENADPEELEALDNGIDNEIADLVEWAEAL